MGLCLTALNSSMRNSRNYEQHHKTSHKLINRATIMLPNESNYYQGRREKRFAKDDEPIAIKLQLNSLS
jgi:hypothetical protein